MNFNLFNRDRDFKSESSFLEIKISGEIYIKSLL